MLSTIFENDVEFSWAERSKVIFNRATWEIRWVSFHSIQPTDLTSSACLDITEKG